MHVYLEQSGDTFSEIGITLSINSLHIEQGNSLPSQKPFQTESMHLDEKASHITGKQRSSERDKKSER